MGYSSQELQDLGIALVKEAESRKAQLRLLGGLAVNINCPKGRLLPALQRDYKDLDFIVDRRGARELKAVFAAKGWVDDHRFNAIHGETRMLFYYEESLQADIFVRVFAQCHRIDFKNLLDLAGPTIPVAELLMTKLQVHELNEKDLKDIVMLLHDHDFGHSGTGDELKELNRLLETTSNDWGWYTTIHDNLVAVESLVGNFLEDEHATIVVTNLKWIRQSIELSPKSMKWNLRSKIGRRLRWYEEPEEVNR